MSENRQSLFQYAVLRHPTKEESKKGRKSEVVVEVATVLAPNEQAAAIVAARDIPEEHLSDIDQLEVVIRPF